MHAIVCCDVCPIWLVTSISFLDQQFQPSIGFAALTSFLNAVQPAPTLVTLEACAIHYPAAKTFWNVLGAIVLR
jgi:hypothetical protein